MQACSRCFENSTLNSLWLRFRFSTDVCEASTSLGVRLFASISRLRKVVDRFEFHSSGVTTSSVFKRVYSWASCANRGLGPGLTLARDTFLVERCWYSIINLVDYFAPPWADQMMEEQPCGSLACWHFAAPGEAHDFSWKYFLSFDLGDFQTQVSFFGAVLHLTPYISREDFSILSFQAVFISLNQAPIEGSFYTAIGLVEFERTKLFDFNAVHVCNWKF